MLRIGYNPPVGWLAGGMRAWATSGRASERLEEVSAPDLHRRLAAGEVELLDVRQPAEWAAGHVDGATFVTGAEVPSRPEAVPAGGRPLVVMCGTGFRSSVIASWLQARGRADVLNLVGGMSGWRAAGLPTVGSTI
jgi:hydroxyacylglutathione hydrolase